MSKNLLLTVLIIALSIVLLPCLVSAQPAFPESPEQAPISSSILLLISGCVYAYYKLRNNK